MAVQAPAFVPRRHVGQPVRRLEGDVAVQLDDRRVLIASLDDLIRMKRAAGRPKDLLAIEELGALREELDRKGSRS